MKTLRRKLLIVTICLAVCSAAMPAVYADDAAAEVPEIEEIIDSIIPETDLLPTVTPQPEKTETKITISFRIGDSTLKINGENVTVTTPFEENGTTLVPLRVITEAFGAAVDWNDAEQSVTLTCDGNTIKLWIDSADVQINGEKAILPMDPRLVNDTTMVPLRFISENFGADVSYDEKTESVLVEKTVIEDLAVDDYSSILHNSDKEYVGDSYYGWKMKSLKELNVASRSFDGRTTGFTGQGESVLIISIESIGDMDKDTIFSAAKKAVDGITVSKQEESKDINGNDCLTIEGKTSDSKMLIKAVIDGETLFTLYAAGETDNGADEVLTAARTFTAGAHNFSDALDLSDVKDNKRVYENKKLNFSIELPADWREVSDSNIENRIEFTNASVSDESYSRISVGIQSKNNMESAEKWAQRDYERNNSAFNPDCAEFSDSLIDDSFAGNPAKYYTYKLTYTYDNSVGTLKDVFFEKGEYVYNFSFYSRGNDDAGLSVAENSVAVGEIDYSEVGDLLLVDEEEGSKKYNGLNGVSFIAPDYWTAVYGDGYIMVSNGAMTVSATVIDEIQAKYVSENLYEAYGSQFKSFKKLSAPMYRGIGGKTGYYFAFTYKDSRNRLYAYEVFAYNEGSSCVVFENDVMFENMGEMSKEAFETAVGSAELN